MAQVLTMTRIIGDVDTVALMGYCEADNKPQYVWNFVRDTYGAENVVVFRMASKAFKQTAELNGISRPLVSGNRSRYINPMHDLYADV